MAVNVGQRNVPDTPQNRQLEACQKAKELALHTIKICKNKNIFTEEYQEALTNKIIRCATDIYLTAGRGNDVYVKKGNGRWIERVEKQSEAIELCNDMLRYIDMARSLFHLKGKKVRYWSGLVIETRALLKKWKEATVKEHGM
ncbi:MAG: four helix bundle protein [Eubacterium sp.]|nr:four helix bundle protein [Eubacterium sp.]MBQ4458012.1 four helix bundle protein [Clostridia bacterium]